MIPFSVVSYFRAVPVISSPPRIQEVDRQGRRSLRRAVGVGLRKVLPNWNLRKKGGTMIPFPAIPRSASDRRYYQASLRDDKDLSPVGATDSSPVI